MTTIELFFDLVFAFTLTQLTALLARRLTAAGLAQVLLIFGLLWWMYAGYAWLTNTRAPVSAASRILLLAGMAGFLAAGLAIPRGLGPGGLVLGLGYLVAVAVHAILYYRVNPGIVKVAIFNLASALLVVAAGVIGVTDGQAGQAGYALWAAALAIQISSPLVVHPGGRFEIRPAHFAERHGALIIVAIGESVAAIGVGAAGLPVSASLVTASVLGLALAAVLWWAYFGTGDDGRGERSMRAARPADRPGLALAAYFYAHIPLLLGIVLVAVGMRAAIRAGGQPHLTTALVLGGGAALFFAGEAAFRRALRTGRIMLCVTGAVFALLTSALGATVAIEAQQAMLAAGLAVVLALDARTAAPAAAPGPAAG